MSEGQAERCEACRFWECLDETEPKWLTRREYIEDLGLSVEGSIWTAEQLEELIRNDNRDGECRRRSPMVFGREGVEKVAIWPVTNYWDWCGEWQSIGPDLRHVGSETE